MIRVARGIVAASLSAALALLALVVLPASPVAAAPIGPGATFTASGSGDLLRLGVTSFGLNLAGVNLAHTTAMTDSAATARSTAESRNLGAAVAGLPLVVSSRGQSAPPDNPAPISGDLVGLKANVPGLLALDLSALSVTDHARWPGNAICATDGMYSTARVQAASATIGLATVTALQLGVSSVSNTNSLVGNGLKKAVSSQASGSLAGLSLLNGTVAVDLANDPKLTATASGVPGGASAESNNVVVSVTIAGVTTTLNPGVPLPIPGLGSITLNAPTVTASADGRSASATWTLLSINVSALAPQLTASIGVLPMSASATAPVDGIDCPPPAPRIIDPAEGAATADRTPTYAGTALPGATVTVNVDGASAGTATADGAGAWSLTPTKPSLTDGDHSVSATQTVNGATGPPSPTRTFAVDGTAPPVPTVTSPAEGATVADPTPSYAGTAEPGATVTVIIDGDPIGTTRADAGAWTLTQPAALAQGTHDVTATAADARGNVSAPAPVSKFVIDSVAPVPPVITFPQDSATIADSTPTVTGTGEIGASVTVTVDATALGPVTVDAEGKWQIPVTPALPDGDHTLVATQTDPAGNVSLPSPSRAFAVDVTAPDAPVITAPADGATINNTPPTITGRAEIGAAIEVSLDGTVIGTVTADPAGQWTVPVTVTLTDGEYGISAVATDAVGNASDPGTSKFTVDTAAPDVPVITSPAARSAINDSTPAISGKGEPGAVVTVSDGDGTSFGRATVTAAGNWQIPDAPLLPDGAVTITATQVDPAGNVSPPSAPVSFTVDTAAPAAPVIIAPNADAVIGDSTPTVIGTGEAGASVTVTVDATALGSVTVDADGKWQVTVAPALSDGKHTITASQTDPVGNASVSSASVAFTVDTAAPAAPVITAPMAASITGSTPIVTGTGEIGASVTVTVDATALGPVTVDADGKWQIAVAPALPEGAHSVSATQADVAGNVSVPSTPIGFTVDASAPAAPVITAPNADAVIGDNTPTVIGTGEAGASVTVAVDATALGSVTVDADGKWQVTVAPALSDGKHSVSATQADVAGNVSVPSTPIGFTVDASAPAAPVIIAPNADAVIGDSTPTVIGKGEAGASVTVTVDATALGSVTVDADGKWQVAVAPALSDGKHTIAASQTDPAGNASVPSASVAFTVDTAAPAAPVIIAPPAGATFTDPAVIVTGTGEPGASVTVTDQNGTQFGPVLVDGAKQWSVQLPDLGTGAYTVTATQTDAVGNVSPLSVPLSFAVDTTAPAAPAITAPANGAISTDNTPTLVGTGEPGSTVLVRDQHGDSYGPATVDPEGAWLMRVAPALTDGVYSMTAVQTDPAGHASGTSTPVSFAVDTTAPAAPVVSNPADGSTSFQPLPVISGTAEALSTVTISIDGKEVSTAEVKADKTFAVTLTSALAVGAHRVSAIATDAAGLNSAPSAVSRFTVAAVAKPVITEPRNGLSTDDVTPTIAGTGQPGAGMAIVVDGARIGKVTVDSTGRWAYTPTANLAAGKHTATVLQTVSCAPVTVGPTAAESGCGEPRRSAAVSFTVTAGSVQLPTITSPTPGSTVWANMLTVSGTGQPGSTIVITDETGRELGRARVDSGGAWSVTVRLADGAHTLTVTQTGEDGTSISSSVSIGVDGPDGSGGQNSGGGGGLALPGGVGVAGLPNTGAPVSTLTVGGALLLLAGLALMRRGRARRS